MTNPTPPEYWDDLVRIVEPPTESRGTIHLAADGAGVACSIELSATGAAIVADLLRTAATDAAAGLMDLDLGIDEDGQT